MSGRIEAIEDWRKRRFCSKACSNDYQVGERNPNYVDGLRRGHNWGYLRVSDGRYLHRIVMERHLGRPLESHEHVHHLDGNVLNNAIENLAVMSNSEHRREHARHQKRDKGTFTA